MSEKRTLIHQDQAFEKKYQQLLEESAIALAHEVRNPLTAMITAIDILNQAQEISDENKSLIQILKSEVLHLKKLLDEFVKYTRPTPIKLSKTDIGELVTETIDMLAPQTPANVKTVLSLDKNLPKIEIDVDQIRQVLINIIINAFEAMPSGGILQCTTKFVPIKDDGSAIKICISDTGPGFTKEIRPHLFEPFFSTKENGTGLGLTISRKIIENHGGKIMVDNGSVNGARFTILLPVSTSAKSSNHTNKMG